MKDQKPFIIGLGLGVLIIAGIILLSIVAGIWFQKRASSEGS